MYRSVRFALPLALCTPVLAQKVEFPSQDSQEARRITITSEIHLTEARKMLVEGEEVAGRGGRGARGGGGPAEIELSQEIVFDEGPVGSSWRHYHKLTAKESRTGRDGEPRESTVEGVLAGKKVYLRETDAGLEIREGEGDDAVAMPAVLSRGVPSRVSLAGFLPDEPVEVGEEYDIGKDFLTALRGLVHPVTPDRSAAEDGGRGRGDRGGRRGRGAGRGGLGGPGSTVIQLIANARLDTDATGKVLRVEEVDGARVAVVSLTAKLTGKGDAGALGLGPPAGRGRGFGVGDTEIDADIRIEGTARVQLETGLVTSVELRGEMGIERDARRTTDRGGEEREIQTLTETKGRFQLTAACEPVKG